ncbi:putative PIF1 [Colletotrichum karsti]|uniref:ATP-dependent DNA helicase n=1 Tax=Colletotrichum karsti TaxID=1095194 RepID=A0A9P6IDM9_9PEZI|nr:putative PIF1 [Colletotrichum karsti]KAF9876775.1 putative PIF1 [Colletotrichum karsti]
MVILNIPQARVLPRPPNLPQIAPSVVSNMSLPGRGQVHEPPGTRFTLAPSPKRRRVELNPEPDYINLVSDEEEEERQDGKPSFFFDLGPKQRSSSRNARNAVQPSRSRASVAGSSQGNTQSATRPPAETEMQRKARIDTAAKRLATSVVDSLMPQYLQGVPEKVYGKKKAKKGKINNYYVVWSGRKCGIFTDWATCEAQVRGWPNQGYQGEEHYEDAKIILRERLIKRLTEEKMSKLIDEDRQLNHSQFSSGPSNGHRYQHYQQPPLQQHLRVPDSGVSENGAAEESGGEDFIPVEDNEPAEVSKEPPLCEEQQDAMDLAMQGRNLFITGSGGCGKSVLVRALYDRFKAMGKSVYLIAPTGQAALNIGGRTTFNYATWYPDDMKKPLAEVFNKIRGKKVRKRLLGTDVLIIDEISMVENLFFDRFSRYMCHARNNSSPLGGVQVIAVGDFCQLPPVMPFQNCTSCSVALRRQGGVYFCGQSACELYGQKFMDEDKWAFRSPEWNRCAFEYVHLTKIHRQRDEQFVNVLQNCRLGRRLGKGEIDLLLDHKCEAPDKSADAFYAPHSQKPLHKLKEHRYSKLGTFNINMPVVLLSNMDLKAGLCNGSQGIVCGFVPPNELEEPKYPNEDNYKDDPSGYRAATQRYSQITAFVTSRHTPDQFPKVRFANGEVRAIGPDCTVSEIGAKHPYSLLSRTQIPLAPGWAMTFHKSQSLSLDRVIVNLGAAWEKGQAYVAVSRARSLRGLKVLGLTAATVNSKFELDPMVKSFMEQLEARKKAESVRNPRQRESGVVAHPGPPPESEYESESEAGYEPEFGYSDEDLCQGENPYRPEE